MRDAHRTFVPYVRAERVPGEQLTGADHPGARQTQKKEIRIEAGDQLPLERQPKPTRHGRGNAADEARPVAIR
jgi:hypothetical protein